MYDRDLPGGSGGAVGARNDTTDQMSEIDLRDLLRVLWRRKAAIAGTTILFTVLATIILFQIPPRYTASALAMIDGREQQVIDIEAVVSGLPGDQESIQSEIEVIQSRGLAEKTVRKLELFNNPEFNAAIRPETFWASTSAAMRQWVRSALFLADPPATTAEDQFDQERVAIIETFLGKLEVNRRGRSRVIEIAFESEDPRTAVLVANTLADLYVVEQLEANFEMTQQATTWLSDRLTGMREAVAASEAAVEEFRSREGLIEGDRSSLAVQQISELSRELILSRTARAEADVRLRQAETLLKSSGGVESAAEVLSSTLIQRLREQEAEVQRKAAELATEYGEKHPRMINIRAEIRDLEAKIEGEVRKIIQNLRNEVSVAHARERSLQKSLDSMEQDVAGLNSKEIQLRALEREATANRTLYETFLARFKETSAQEELQQTDVRIIARADLPSGASFPKKKLIISLVLVGSLFLGVVLAFAIEQLDHGFRSMEQVERLTGIPSIGLVPAVGRAKGSPEKYIVTKPTSVLGEAARTIYTSLILSNVDSPPKVILVTSALPKEGKTTISLLLGRMFAMLGKRVIVIDTDLRRPQVHVRLGIPAAPGLVELLTGAATQEEVVKTDEATGAHIIAAGTAGPNASELLNSERLKTFLQTIGANYDLVILDSPPTMAVADARILAHHADKTILVVRWASTRREVVEMSLRQLAEAGADLAGVVLSRVNVRRHAGYGYGDSGYYYGSARKYYTG